MLGNKDININTFNLLLVIFVALGTLATAYGLAIIGSTVGQPNFYAYFHLAAEGEPGYAHTTNIIGALNGANSAGAVIGCALSAWSADKLGRKRAIQLGCVILIVGGALNAGSVAISMFAIGRMVAGIGSGLLAVVVPLYQAEVATAETRGAMTCVTGIMYAYGYSLAGWMGYGCVHIPGTSPHAQAAWRAPLAFQCVPPLIVLAGSRFVPQSPRWLLSRDRREEAFHIIKHLHARKDDQNHIQAREEYYLMKKQFEADKKLSLHRSFEIFRTKANRRRAYTSMALMTFDQFEGLYVIANYGVLIYQSLGLKGNIPLLLNACWTTFTIIGNTWTFFFIDRIGRRPLLLIGTTGVLVSQIFLAALSATYLGTNNHAGLSATVFFLWLAIFFWCFCMDATQFTYVSEIWPNHLRSQGTALGLACFFLTSEVTLVAAPVALNNVGWKFYLVLICPTVIYIPVIYFFFPETKGRTLEELGELFGDKHIAAHWYGISESERKQIEHDAMVVTEDGRVLGSPEELKSSENNVETAEGVAKLG